MLLIYDVETIFDKKIQDTFKEKPELLSFFMKHERRNMVIENLKSQLKKTELSHPRLLTKKNREQIIQDAAVMFMKAATTHKEQQLMSDNKKIDMIHKADKYKRAEEMLQDLEKEESAPLKSYVGEVAK